jgi:hypothetical protein
MPLGIKMPSDIKKNAERRLQIKEKSRARCPDLKMHSK